MVIHNMAGPQSVFSRNGFDQVARWLAQGGLGKYSEHFASCGVDEAVFRSLLMQDYPKYGVQALEDKQRLFRLIKTVNNGVEPMAEQPPTPPSFFNQMLHPNGIDSFLSTELRGDARSGSILDIHAIDDSELLGVHTMADPFYGMPGNSMLERDNAPAPRPPPPQPSLQVPERDGQRPSGWGQAYPSQAQFADPHAQLSLNHMMRQADASPRRPSTPAEKEIPVALGRNLKNDVARIRVVVRKRPLNKKEQARKEDDIVSIAQTSSSLTVHEPRVKVDLTAYVEKHEFVFDAVLNETVTNDEVYSRTVEPIVPCIFNKTKATCFAYGQTGSGKTYTMQPLPLRAAQDMLSLMQTRVDEEGAGLHLWLSFFEIYGGKVYDLLNDRGRLCMREDGRQQVCIVGLKEFRVTDVYMVKDYIDRGNAARSTGSTGANEESSRSHAILQLALKRHKDGDFARPGKPVGKFSFIDLAGSERGADTTDNDRQTRIEGAEINKSLLALKECIRALDHDQGHIPFRGSKLTEVLRDSFMGDSRTVMIANISPNCGSCEHTLNTLRYADRVKSLSKAPSQKKDSATSAVNSGMSNDDSQPPAAPQSMPPLQAYVPPTVPTFQQAPVSAPAPGLNSYYAAPAKQLFGSNTGENKDNPFQPRQALAHSPAPQNFPNNNTLLPPTHGNESHFLGTDALTSIHAGMGRMTVQDGKSKVAEDKKEVEHDGDVALQTDKALEEQPRGARARFGFGMERSQNFSEREKERERERETEKAKAQHLPEVDHRRDVQPHILSVDSGLLSRQSFERSPGKNGMYGSGAGGGPGSAQAQGPSGSPGAGRWEAKEEDNAGKVDGSVASRVAARRRIFSNAEDGDAASIGLPPVKKRESRDDQESKENGVSMMQGLRRRSSQEERAISSDMDRHAPWSHTEVVDAIHRRREAREDGSVDNARGTDIGRSQGDSPSQFQVHVSGPERDDSASEGKSPAVGIGRRQGREEGAPGQEVEVLLQKRWELASKEDGGGLPDVHGRLETKYVVKDAGKPLNGMVGFRRTSTEVTTEVATPIIERESDNSALLLAHDELMTAILEEEEEVITQHRKQIEETMETVREEMQLLAEVDQPGSQIDDYVTQLSDLLARRAESIADLQERLLNFQRHLKEEETLSRTVGFSSRVMDKDYTDKFHLGLIDVLVVDIRRFDWDLGFNEPLPLEEC